MNTAPLISVIVPVYNGEKYLRSCLENILTQSYSNLEIIVINDGSTDQSKSIAEQFPIQLIDFEQNRGLSAARNAGMDQATGEYIHFLDVDDAISEDYYKKMIESANSNDADVACGGMVNKAKNFKTRVYKKNQVAVTVEDKLELTYVGKWGYVWRYLFRLEYLRKQNLRFEEGRLIEDLMFSLPAVFFANKVVVVAGVYYTYFLQENSIMTNKDKAHRQKRRADRKYAGNYVLNFAEEHNFKIPGVNKGRIGYVARKLLMQFKAIFNR